MKWTIHICSGVRDHFDLSNVEFCPLRIVFARFLAREKVANDRRGKTLVSNHPMLNFMAKVNEFITHPISPLLFVIARTATTTLAPAREAFSFTCR
jgi:hypothetical protein